MKHRKEKKIRVRFVKIELKLMRLKYLSVDRLLLDNSKYFVYFKLKKVSRTALSVQFNNRCVITGRSRSVYRVFGLSRIVFRQFSLNGRLVGVRKASW